MQNSRHTLELGQKEIFYTAFSLKASYTWHQVKWLKSVENTPGLNSLLASEVASRKREHRERAINSIPALRQHLWVTSEP